MSWFSNLLPAITNANGDNGVLQGNLQSPNLVGGSGLLPNIVNAIASPVVQTARTIGGGAFEAARALSSAAGNKNAYLDPQGNVVQDPFLSQQDLEKYHTDPTGQVVNQAKNSAALASYGIPIGGTTSLAGKTIGASALKGGALMGAAQSLPTAKNAGDIALGAVAGAAGGVVGNKIGKVLTKPAEATIEGATQPSENALRLAGGRFLRGQYNASPATMEEFNPEHTLQLADWGIYSPKEVMNAAKVYTGADGIATNVIKGAVAKANPVPVTGLKDAADNIMQHIYGVEPKDQTQFFKNTWQELASKVPSKPTVINGVTTDISTKDPSETYTFLQNLRKEASNLASSGNAANRNIAPAYRQFANAVDDKLYLSPKLDKNGLNIGGAGANDILNNSTLTPQQSAALNNISPRLASDTQDAMQNGTIGDIKHMQQSLVTGNNAALESAGRAKGSPLSLRQIIAGYIALHNPAVGVPYLLASSSMGENALGKVGINAAKASATMKVLPAITSGAGGKVGASVASNALPQIIPGDGNKYNPDNNPDNHIVPPSTSATSSIPPVVKTVPTSQDQIMPDANGHLGVYDSFGPNGVTASTLKQGQQIASINSQIAGIEGQTSYKYDLKAQAQVTALNTQLTSLKDQYNLGYSQLAQPQAAALSTANLYNSSYDLLQQADPNILSVNDTYDKLKTIQTGPYATLAVYIHNLENASGVPIFIKGMNTDVLKQSMLAAASSLMWKNYYAGLNVYTGGTQPTNNNLGTTNQLPPIAPPANNSIQANQTFAPIQKALPPIQ